MDPIGEIDDFPDSVAFSSSNCLLPAAAAAAAARFAAVIPKLPNPLCPRGFLLQRAKSF